jgi:succinyl-CoA synthetase alpha subunit
MFALKRLPTGVAQSGLRNYSSSGYASTAKNLLINADTKVIFQGISDVFN